MELQSFLLFVGILVAICIPCASCAWLIRKAMADMQVGLSDLRGDMKVLNERMSGLGQRMDGLGGEVNGLKEEVRGINEFLWRDSVKGPEKNKES